MAIERIKLNYLTLLIMTFLAATAYAHNWEVDGIYYKYVSEGIVTVTYRGSSYSDYSDEYSGSVIIPANVTYRNFNYKVISIDQYAFRDCSGLTNLIIPNTVTNINDISFYGCSSLTGIAVEDGNPQYDSRDNCNAIIETTSNKLIAGCQSTVIPNTILTIGSNSFYACTGLTNVIIPNSVTTIQSDAFAYCPNLTNVSIGDNVIQIGSGAFAYCSELTNVSIGDNVIQIGGGAFSNCRKLANIILPYNLSITLPSIMGDYNIGYRAFYLCESLNSIVCKAITPPRVADYSSIYPSYYMATLYVPKRSVEAYKATEFWSNFINIVGFDSDGDVPQNGTSQRCDTNDDGEVNIADVNRVIDEILNH